MINYVGTEYVDIDFMEKSKYLYGILMSFDSTYEYDIFYELSLPLLKEIYYKYEFYKEGNKHIVDFLELVEKYPEIKIKVRERKLLNLIKKF